MQPVTRRFALTASLCAALLSSPVHAQAPKDAGATRTVKITLEQRHVIRELVKELKVESAKDDLKVGPGDEIPGTVALQPMPPLIGQKVPSIKAHRLYVTQNRILIVDPQDQKVVEVIE